MSKDKERLDVAIKRIRWCYNRVVDDGKAHPDAVLSDLENSMAFLLDYLEPETPKAISPLGGDVGSEQRST